MSAVKVIKIEKMTPEEIELKKKIDRAIEWQNKNMNWILEKYKGKYIVCWNEEIFAGDTWQEAERKAKTKYSDCNMSADFIPEKRGIRIL
jgi:hypothetical protein